MSSLPLSDDPKSDPAARPAREGQPPASAANVPAVVLVRPREEGNLGMVARAMANMGLHELVLVGDAPAIGGTARGFGVGAWHVLDGARRFSTLDQALAPFQVAVGTASTRDRPLRDRVLVDARSLAERIDPASRVALVFGPEDHGLSRAELERCQPIVVVPCAPEQPTLNLAQAVLLVAYELRMARLARASDRPPAPPVPLAEASSRAALGEVEELVRRTGPVLHRLGFDHRQLHATLVRDLRRLLSRAAPTAREIGLLRRLLDRTAQRLGEERGEIGRCVEPSPAPAPASTMPTDVAAEDDGPGPSRPVDLGADLGADLDADLGADIAADSADPE